jgi:ubiquitin carboxyl-terminal hydrolase 25/28
LKDPENPFDRKRESLEVPGGIKNVGNTCYINSLLQAIFMVPRFRTAILEYPLPVAETPGERLIHELQLLFTRMLLTERRYVDPSPLLEFTSHHGAQEDPTELFLALLEKIREGILKHPAVKAAPPPEEDVGTRPMDLGDDVPEPKADLISRFFEGSCWQSVEAVEADGKPIERMTSEKFMQIICSVPQSNSLQLHDLLEHFTSVSLIEGYQTPGGHTTQARRSVLFEELPPILTIQLQRVSWTNNALQKNNAKVVFDEVMTMDR